jgi:GntR family transcriptional regulator of vanillate catabolism
VLAKSPPLSRAIAQTVVLPFASPGALLSSQAVLPGSREILVVAQHHHRILIDAIREGHSARAEEVGREHARLTLASLDLVLENHPLVMVA